MRDLDFLKRQTDRHGKSIGAFARCLLDVPLPWTRMRRVYALLGLVKKFGEARVEDACTTALAFDMHDVRRLQRMLAQAIRPPESSAPSPKVIPLARYLRPTSQYALSLARREPTAPQPIPGDER